ncbi:hypothetical protein K435DRAFT_764008 [Dendrothele bispora CBS 962.96]|uniref:Uncharacterized protein n=1 Tax=Dendrothele bispora (strain CBS 962.96) TaxID=1314807 RepID=A0A4S8LAI7_DENBC|nr:hypothetical protein K435DRAFT_764008 [Dendrothele bispora CBS 962.96]
MKSLFLSFFFMILVASSPLGDRSLISRHNSGVPLLNARKYVLRSNLQAPPSCTSGVNIPSSVPSGVPAPSVAGEVNATTTDPSFDPTTTISPNATDSGVVPDANSTATDVAIDPTATDGSVATDTNTTSTDSFNSTDATTTATPSNSTDASLSKRFAQLDLPNLAFTWQELCLASGGDIFTHDPCVQLAGVGGINALLANADPCDQQDIADAMIDFARSEGVINSDDLIAFAVQYRRHPRNALNILGVVPSSPYCLIAPRNPELIGIYNDQVEGVVPGLFGGPNFPIVPFGEDGSCPFGMTPDVSTCSCLPPDASGETGITGDTLNGTDVSDVNGVDTGITGDNSTDTSLDGGDLTDFGSSNTTSTTNSTDATSTATADLGNSTDTSTSTDSSDDSTDVSDSQGTDGDTTVTSDTSSTESASASDTETATATVSDVNVTASATDTGAVNANTGVADVNDPAGR